MKWFEVTEGRSAPKPDIPDYLEHVPVEPRLRHRISSVWGYGMGSEVEAVCGISSKTYVLYGDNRESATAVPECDDCRQQVRIIV